MEDPLGVLACNQLQIKFLPKIEENQIYTLTAILTFLLSLPYSTTQNPIASCGCFFLRVETINETAISGNEVEVKTLLPICNEYVTFPWDTYDLNALRLTTN